MFLRRSSVITALPVVVLLIAQTSALPQTLLYETGDEFADGGAKKAKIRLADTDIYDCEGKCSGSITCC